MAVPERTHARQGPEPIHPDAVMDQNDAFPGAADLVLELDASERCPIHALRLREECTEDERA